jgi:hypothetical protein
VSDSQFYLYAGLLTVSGLLLLALAITGFGQSTGTRVLNALFGLGFTGYGGYLLLFFEGGEVRIFFYAFIVPVLMVIQAVRTFMARRNQLVQPGQPIPETPASGS